VRVDVLEVLGPSQEVVAFRCDFGSALGRWMGGVPVRLGTSSVEFDIVDEVSEWVEIDAGSTALSGRLELGSGVRFECEVLRVGEGEDSVVEVRLGPDVLLVEILSRKSDLPVGGLVSFWVAEVRLYPYDA